MCFVMFDVIGMGGIGLFSIRIGKFVIDYR